MSALEVPFQMRPAPLQPPEAPVHTRPIAVDDGLASLAQQLPHDVGAAAEAAGKEGKRRGHQGPYPGLGGPLFGGGFVEVQRVLAAELVGKFLVGGQHGLGGTVLQVDHPAGAGGLVENRVQKVSGAAFGLAKAGHEQRNKGDQARTGLPAGHAPGQFAAGRATTGANQPVLLVFDDERLNLGEFPNLMTQGLGIQTIEFFATASANGGHARDHLVALLRGNQRA